MTTNANVDGEHLHHDNRLQPHFASTHPHAVEYNNDDNKEEEEDVIINNNNNTIEDTIPETSTATLATTTTTIPDKPVVTPNMVTPMPWNALIIVVLIHVADMFSFTTLAPYIVDLVQDMGLVPDGDKRKIGYYAGLIGSSYYVAQFFSAFIWGFISDRFGRRIVLLVGVGGSSITSLMFGFSKRLYWCLLSRVLFGLVNGNLGTYKVMLSELSDKTNQAKVFSYLGVSFSIGSIVGPLIGGFLADPMKQYPVLNKIFPQHVIDLLVYFPFLLPNVVVCLNNVLAFVLAFFFLKETNPAVLKKSSRDDHHRDTEMIEEEKEEQNDDEQHDSHQDDLNEHDEQELDLELEQEQEQHQQQASDQLQPIASFKSTWKQKLSNYFRNEMFTSRYPMTMVAVYAIIGFSSVIFAECLPLLLVLKPEFGGIDFSQKQIGILNGACGVLMFFWQIFFCARIVKALGAVRAYQWMTLIHIPVYVFFPMVNYVYSTPWLMWTLLIFFYTMRYAVSQVMFAAMSILTNNSVTSINMGKLNGISQSAVAFTRAIAPSLGGVMFSWSLSFNIFPFNIYFVWIFTSLTYVLALVIVIGFPASLNEPKQSPSISEDKQSLVGSKDEESTDIELISQHQQQQTRQKDAQ